jgi:two-component system sensor histidine kinase KdpD
VIKQADEVVMVDVTPEALINRLKRGVVYAPDKATKALENFFREQSLAGLRELALRQAAHEVDVRHERPPSSDRLLIHVTGEPTTAMLIRRGRRVADYLRAECFAIYVSESGDLHSLPTPEREAVDRHLNFARHLHIETRILEGHNVAASLVDFARRERITQIFLMRTRGRHRKVLLGGSLISEILRLAPDMQITVVAERGGSGTT